MRTRSSLGTLALALTLAPTLATAPPAGAATLAGVTMPDRAAAGDQELVLNGMALRKKFFIKVYVGGLYLEERQSSAEKVLAADTPRIMRMEFLYGVSKDQMCDAWNDGLEANTPNASAELERQFETLCGWMEDIDDGEGAEFTYVPGSGTAVRVKGQEKGTIEGKAFADALLRCWIGPDPDPGEAFKEAVLGA
jgi:hypothetical protein